MAVFPGAVGYGRVRGTILRAVADTADADAYPDASPAVGSITFTPAVTGTITFTGISATVVVPDTIKFTFDGTGSFDGYLVATDDSNPSNWTYAVSFDIPGVTIPTFNVAIPAGSDNPIDSFLPVGISSGVLTVRGPQGPSGTGGGGGTPDDNSVSTTKIQDGAVTLAKLAPNSVNGNKIVDGSVAAAEIAASLKPSGSAAGTDEALRALGATSSTAAAGNDSRLSNARTPTAHAATHAVGGTDALVFQTTTAILASDVAGAVNSTNDLVSVSLGVGTYLLEASLSAVVAANNSNIDLQLVAGTATCSFAGGGATSASGSTASPNQSLSTSCFCTVTVAGTVKMQMACSKATTAKALSVVSSTVGATALAVLQIA